MNKEQIHDTKIGPLMDQIIAICEEHKIAMLASFALPVDDNPGLGCITLLLTDEYEPHRQQRLAAVVLIGNQEVIE